MGNASNSSWSIVKLSNKLDAVERFLLRRQGVAGALGSNRSRTVHGNVSILCRSYGLASQIAHSWSAEPIVAVPDWVRNYHHRQYVDDALSHRFERTFDATRDRVRRSVIRVWARLRFGTCTQDVGNPPTYPSAAAQACGSRLRSDIHFANKKGILVHVSGAA